MSQPGSSASASRHQDDEEVESVDEPPRKQQKLEQETQQSIIVNSLEVKMDDLPYDVIVKILSFLSVTELTELTPHVCSQWRRASQDPLVWRIKIYRIGCDIPDAEALTSLHRFPQLRSLFIYRPVNDDILNAMCDNCPNLIRLLIFTQRQQISDSLLNKLVVNCKKIQSLMIPHEIVADERKAQLCAQLVNLQSLKVTGDINSNKRIHLGPLGDGCPVLSKLEVSEKRHLCTEDLNLFITGKCSTLADLSLPWIDKYRRCVVPLLKNCISLVNLKLYDDSNKIGEILEACTALSHLNNLRSLILFFWDDVAVADAVAFKSGSLLHLRVLKINALYLQKSVLEAICRCCPNLNELHLSRCRGLNDGDLKELRHLRKLETLALSSCKHLRGEALVNVAQISTLRKFTLAWTDLMDLIPGLFSILEMSSLEILSLPYTSNTCYFPLNCIPAKLTNLRVLKVKACELDPGILEQLKQRMPGLKIYTPCFNDWQ